MFKFAAHPVWVGVLIVAVSFFFVQVMQPSTARLYGYASQADRFFTCSNGFVFEVRHQAARCVRYPQENFVAPEACKAPFAVYSSDYLDTQDVCRNHTSQTTPLTCPGDAEIYIQPGNDLCVRRFEGAVSAPVVITKR